MIQRYKTPFIILLVALLSILAVVLTFVMVRTIQSGGESLNSFTRYPELARRQTFAMDTIKRLELDYKSDQVEILISDSNELIVEEYINRVQDRNLADITQSDDVIRIESGKRQRWYLFGFQRACVKVYVPVAYAGALDAASSSGKIELAEFPNLSSLRLDCSSGSIETQPLHVSGDVSLSANSGSLQMDSVDAGGNLDLKTSSGSIKSGALRSGKDIYAKATSGFIKLGDVTATGICDLEASSGAIKIGVITADRIRGNANSGSVRLAGANAAQTEVSTSSGTVQIDQASGSGNLQASSGQVECGLSDTSGTWTMDSTSGSVTITVPSNASFQLQADTNSGGIRTSFDDQLTTADDGKSVSGTVGGASGGSLKLSTSSGSIRVLSE